MRSFGRASKNNSVTSAASTKMPPKQVNKTLVNLWNGYARFFVIIYNQAVVKQWEIRGSQNLADCTQKIVDRRWKSSSM
ncbi:hypothetical protein GCM10022395_00820 [Snuella lapsa]|uniref:Uncharacterized protein n=1 Tax=Snuella lapsa TaxID=870481 RepID=A0ABP6WN58_9FLAO